MAVIWAQNQGEYRRLPTALLSSWQSDRNFLNDTLVDNINPPPPCDLASSRIVTYRISQRTTFSNFPVAQVLDALALPNEPFLTSTL